MGDVRREADRCQVGPSGPTGPTGSGVSERDTARAALVSASRAGAKTDRRSAGPARPRRKQSKAKQAGEERRGETRQTGSWLEAGRGRKRPNNRSWVPLAPSAGWTHHPSSTSTMDGRPVSTVTVLRFHYYCFRQLGFPDFFLDCISVYTKTFGGDVVFDMV